MLLQRLLEQQLSVMQQFGASMLHTVVCCHKFGEVEYECTLHNSIDLAVNVSKIIKVGENLTQS